MYPYHVFDLEPAGTFGMYPICYQQVSGGYIQPEPAMYSRCFRWFPGPLTPSVSDINNDHPHTPHHHSPTPPNENDDDDDDHGPVELGPLMNEVRLVSKKGEKHPP